VLASTRPIVTGSTRVKSPGTIQPHLLVKQPDLGAQRRARIEVELAGNEDIAVGLNPRSGQPGPPGAFNLSPSSRRGIPNQP
jgi:hypothetical protein